MNDVGVFGSSFGRRFIWSCDRDPFSMENSGFSDTTGACGGDIYATECNGNLPPLSEYTGACYFEPSLNCPVSSASTRRSSNAQCSIDYRNGSHTHGQGYASHSRSSAPQNSEGRHAQGGGTTTKKVTVPQERSRRKGEPFRYDRRFTNRTRSGANEPQPQRGQHGWIDMPDQAGVEQFHPPNQPSQSWDDSAVCWGPAVGATPHAKGRGRNRKQDRSRAPKADGRGELRESGGPQANGSPCLLETFFGIKPLEHGTNNTPSSELSGAGNGQDTESAGNSETSPAKRKDKPVRPTKPGRSQPRRKGEWRERPPAEHIRDAANDGGSVADDGVPLRQQVQSTEGCGRREPKQFRDYSSREWHNGRGHESARGGRREWPERTYDNRFDGDRPYDSRPDRDRPYDNRSDRERPYVNRSDRDRRKTWDCRDNFSSAAFGWDDGQRAQRVSHEKPSRADKSSPSSSKWSPPANKSYPQVSRTDDAPQKERLTEQLLAGEYECLVCCERVRGSEHTWSCGSCYHIFHLHCVRKWALSPAALVKEGGWRCPACQTAVRVVPDRYVCFCGKRVNPEWNRYGVPHSCGEMCGRLRGTPGVSLCTHRCNLQCHPGQCPPCSATVRRACPCGKVTRHVRCSQEQEVSCGALCGRLLNCELHECQSPCHAGPCEPCEHIVHQRCFCGKRSQDAKCTRETAAAREFCCGDPCGRSLSCGRHVCKEVCHFGECGVCPLSPASLTHCPCGKTPLAAIPGAAPRESCADSVATCGETCDKMLQCGPKDNWHRCGVPCHEGPCPPCPRSMLVRCRCGATSRDVPCLEAATLDTQLCQRRCQKRRGCGRHKCLVLCCVDSEHRCQLTCGKRLSCGLHVCQEPCHRGNCPTCWNVSFEDLTCHCGSASLSPPVPCGTRPPECGQPCARPHPCGHPVTHTCHSDTSCPPCAALTEKWCFGRHEKRKAVPCFLEGLSCGLSCQRELPCGQHRCQQTCHLGPCCTAQETDGRGCGQRCNTPRSGCGHPCGEPCHPGRECPNTGCKTLVSISCDCGHRSEKLPCGGYSQEASSSQPSQGFHQLSASLLASKIQEIQLGESVDIGQVLALSRARRSRLECSEDCAVLERNRRLAAALQIHNADVSNRAGPPSYSEFLREEARKNPAFLSSVHQKLTELVQTARQSKQKFRSHSFPSMNRDQRRVVHELAEFFGCETQSYDQEPYRNVVVSAYKDRCRIPSGSVVSVVQREGVGMPGRKGLVPLLPSWKRNPQPSSTPSTLCASTGGTGGASNATPRQDLPSGTTTLVPLGTTALDYFNFESS